VTTLRRADTLVDAMRADRAVAVSQRPDLGGAPPQAAAGKLAHASASARLTPPRLSAREAPPARSWFAGKSVGVILLILGALCVLAAGAVFIAVAWVLLPLAIRALILILITSTFGLFAQLALRRRLQSTAEATAVIACGMFVLDLAAARSAGLPGLADLADAPFEILAGALLAVLAAAAALSVRSQRHWLWSLDAVAALGMARVAIGVLRVTGHAPDVASVAVAVLASLLFIACGRLRLPVAMWSALGLGVMAWVLAVVIGAQRAADHLGGDVGRVADSWPALAVGLVVALWSVQLDQAVWRRVATVLCLTPLLLVFEITGWSHGWVVGASVMLVGYVIAALAAGYVSGTWSSAVGGSATILGVSALVGLLPTLVALGARMVQAIAGSWREPRGLPLDLSHGDVGPWLLPVASAVILALAPRIAIFGHRLSVEKHHVAGVFGATLALLPVLYGAGFWSSIAVLVLVAAILLPSARLLSHDSLLVLGLSLLAIMRICAFYDALADPLAWTLLAAACLAWALSERRLLVRLGFFGVAGLFALAGVDHWMTFAQMPLAVHGLVILAVGSLGLVLSQGFRSSAGTRMVGEGLSLSWMLAGLALADSSPSHRALEVTVAGVAAGITAYISQDRRGAGWASGALLTLASWIRLTDNNIETVEGYTLPAAAALLVYGTRRLRRDPSESTWRCLGPGMALALTPSLMLSLDEPTSWRGLMVALAAVALVALGVHVRLAAPFALGVVATALLALRNIWPVAAFIPRWALLFIIGGALLGTGMTWESRVNDVRTAGKYVLGLR